MKSPLILAPIGREESLSAVLCLSVCRVPARPGIANLVVRKQRLGEFGYLERLSRVFSFSAHEVPAKSGRSAFFNRKLLLGDTVIPYVILGLASWDDDDDYGYDPEDFFDDAGQDEFDDEDTFSDEFDDDDKDDEDGFDEEEDEFDEEECDY